MKIRCYIHYLFKTFVFIIGAKKLTLLETSARIFLHLRLLLTHLARLNSLLSLLNSLAPNTFSSLRILLFLYQILSIFKHKKRDLTVPIQLIASIRFVYCLATSYSSGTSVRLPSALRSLTSVFGMGTGVTSLPLSPDK